VKYVILGALLAVLVLHPALAAAVLGFLGAAAVTVAAKPVVWAFAGGLLAGPRLAARIPRSLL
jgi:hypothetical protein